MKILTKKIILNNYSNLENKFKNWKIKKNIYLMLLKIKIFRFQS